MRNASVLKPIRVPQAVWLVPAFLLTLSLPVAATANDDAARVAAEIDRLIEMHWKAAGVIPGEPADDAEFLRRVSLHIEGCIPPVSQTRTFLDDSSSDKRRRSVDDLLDRPGYVVNFTRYWRRALLPEADADLQLRAMLPLFENWLRQQLSDDVRYDALVRDILTTPLDAAVNTRFQTPSPFAFFQAKQIAPENLAAATSRTFLGIRIECAQCHHHPFDKWQREEFWSFAAFFGGLARDGRGEPVFEVRENTLLRAIKVSGTEKVVQAAYLDGTAPQWQTKVSSRQTLAEWITSRENPYFARAAANRLWGHFFGSGIVEPIDDFNEANPPSHPELLDLLAREFVSHDFDVKFLIRAITASRAYQLSSRRTHDSQADPRHFARMAMQGLTAEQIFDCLSRAAGTHQPFQPSMPFVLGTTPQGEIIETFADGDASGTARETTILQALALMNGQFITQATGSTTTRILGAVADAPFLDVSEKIETLYLAALCRKPRQDELERLQKYIESGSPKRDQSQALGDIFWTLLNSTEFLTNH